MRTQHKVGIWDFYCLFHRFFSITAQPTELTPSTLTEREREREGGGVVICTIFIITQEKQNNLLHCYQTMPARPSDKDRLETR
jgi:hypothetical protein